MGREADFSWDSAGMQGYHIGKQADPRTRKTAQNRGISMNDLRARQITDADFETFDLLLAMDESHLRSLRGMAPENAKHKAQLYLPYCQMSGITEVPDPYYKDQSAFETVLDLIDVATPRLINRLLGL